MASAKQKAAARRNIRKAIAANRRRSKPKRKAPKRRRRASPKRPSKRRRKAAKKTIKRKKSSGGMVFGKKIPILGSPVIKKAATGIGIATIGVTIISLLAPQIAANPIIRPALAFIGGGVPGVIAQVFLSGGASLGSLFGGGGSSGGGGGGAA